MSFKTGMTGSPADCLIHH